MELNNYSVQVPQGIERDGYVVMSHETQYNLVLHNSNWSRCDAKVEIDGKYQGTWRIGVKSGISLDRPAHDTGRFTFYKANSHEGDIIGLDCSDPDIGLIKVTFTPEKEHESVAEVTRGGSLTFGAGGTGLSGCSNQKFGTANSMLLDYANQTTIYIRLVAEAKNTPRPLTRYSTPIPPPIA